MANPKRRHSVSRKHMRRAHDHLVSPHLGLCPKCGQQCRSHQVCGYCGFYRGVEVIKVVTEPEQPAEGAGEKK
ncbi:MAG TPA: 50S ribosomal protein L32 [Planctomycetota bacterium]